jgi:hypothetical protein
MACGVNSTSGWAARWAWTRSRNCPGRAAGLVVPCGLRPRAAVFRRRRLWAAAAQMASMAASAAAVSSLPSRSASWVATAATSLRSSSAASPASAGTGPRPPAAEWCLAQRLGRCRRECLRPAWRPRPVSCHPPGSGPARGGSVSVDGAGGSGVHRAASASYGSHSLPCPGRFPSPAGVGLAAGVPAIPAGSVSALAGIVPGTGADVLGADCQVPERWYGLCVLQGSGWPGRWFRGRPVPAGDGATGPRGGGDLEGGGAWGSGQRGPGGRTAKADYPAQALPSLRPQGKRTARRLRTGRNVRRLSVQLPPAVE